MNVYKIIFANNEVVSCDLVAGIAVEGKYKYEHMSGKLIYALVKAHDENEAKQTAGSIIAEVTKEVFGTDFVF